MGMSGGGTGGAVSEINVTPLIDVLLVLLIIFMVIVPVTPRGLNAIAPQPPKPNAPPPPPNDATIVVSVVGDKGTIPQYKINSDTFAKSEIEPKLAAIFAIRQNKVMFVKGDPDLYYGAVADAINMGHQAGVDNIAIITPKVESGQ
jgi:biopolymer transport protein TolR